MPYGTPELGSFRYGELAWQSAILCQLPVGSAGTVRLLGGCMQTGRLRVSAHDKLPFILSGVSTNETD